MSTPFIYPTLTLAQEDAPPRPPAAPGTDQQTATTEQLDADPSAPTTQQPQGMPTIFYIVFPALLFMIVFSMSGSRKEKKKREAMLSTLKKGDRVQTIGGILGAVVEVRDEHVVVKIDENTNTRVKLSRSAVQSVVQEKDE